MLDYFYELGPWNWFLLAALLFILETIVPGVFLIWFGIAAGVAGAVGLLFGVGLVPQLVIFAVASILVVLMARMFLGYSDKNDEGGTLNLRAQQYVGRNFTLSDAISNGRGRMRVGDTLWTVEGPEMPGGSTVVVTGAKGNVLLVKPVDNDGRSAYPSAGNFD